ncbi:hypothetical protein Golax_013420 [Gossypium laxum]|uniref:Aldose 1-epimerase n=1 Tax=Gossypium laxum TaxID=34288 RepID=A0A7J8ZRM1_9ROSI|nr:hypothetical protein [Gossypium laxum]
MANICSFCVFIVLSSLCFSKAQHVKVYELKRGYFSAKFTNYGATMLSVILPDKTGKLDDVVLGYDLVNDYKNDTTYFGAIVGRVANRIGGAKFILNGVTYKTDANDGKNTLHGGSKGFSDVIWTVKSYKKHSHVTFSYESFDGEEALHTYWNLGGHNSGDIMSHRLKLFGSKITPVDSELIPTGEIVPVRKTPYDFRRPREIGSKFDQLPHGYDINYVLHKSRRSRHLRKVAVVVESKCGRKMELWTNMPGVQFYTSNMLKNEKGKNGTVYGKHAGFCLETQGFPDAVNHPNFPSQIVKPRGIYKHFMVYRFTAH